MKKLIYFIPMLMILYIPLSAEAFGPNPIEDKVNGVIFKQCFNKIGITDSVEDATQETLNKAKPCWLEYAKLRPELDSCFGKHFCFPQYRTDTGPASGDCSFDSLLVCAKTSMDNNKVNDTSREKIKEKESQRTDAPMKGNVGDGVSK
jgi:hypothetical protein